MIVMKNNKWLWGSLAIIILAGIIGFWYFQSNLKSKNNENYTAKRTEASSKSENVNNENNLESNNYENNNYEERSEQEQKNIVEKRVPQFTEEQMASFSTKILTSDPLRQTNINITCNTLNDTIVKKGETFSFCNTVGKATAEKGYKEADIFDKDGNKKKGLGGGNCQISSTLYNAILAIPSINVTERHNHSKSVYYVPDGKDAAVAYGSYDFKFVNNSDNDIKIKCSSDGKTVDVIVLSIKEQI